MVMIYYMGEPFAKKGTKGNKWYRKVRYITSGGKKKKRDLRCIKKTGKLLAKSKTWTTFIDKDSVDVYSSKAENKERAKILTREYRNSLKADRKEKKKAA